MKTPVKKLYEKLWEADKDKFTWMAILNDMLIEEQTHITLAFIEGSISWGTGISPEQYYKKTYEKNDVE